MGKKGGGVKVISKGTPGIGGDVKNVTGMFNQMLGTERPDHNVVKPKYEELIRLLDSISSLINKFGTSVIVKLFPEYITEFKKMVEFAIEIKKKCMEYAVPDSPTDPNDMKDYVNSIVDNYLHLKDCQTVKRLIKVCSVLGKQKKYLGNENKLSAEFIKNSVEPDLCLLDSFTNLPFKQIFISDKLKNKEAKQYVLIFLHMMWDRTYHIYKTITSPDVDVDKFVEIVSKSIDDVKGKIPRCNEAFNKIKNATHMLKDNFGDYYKDFVESENPSIIMENFISDVAQSAEGSPQLVMQFKKIISFYKKNAQAHMQNNPQLKQVFSMVNDQLSALDGLADEEKKKNSKKGEPEEEDSSESSETKLAIAEEIATAQKATEKDAADREKVSKQLIADEQRKKQKNKNKKNKKNKNKKT